jgi:hypothetical protein
VTTTKTAEAADKKAMTLAELEKFIGDAKNAGLTGEAKVTAVLTLRGSVKKITAVD